MNEEAKAATKVVRPSDKTRVASPVSRPRPRLSSTGYRHSMSRMSQKLLRPGSRHRVDGVILHQQTLKREEPARRRTAALASAKPDWIRGCRRKPISAHCHSRNNAPLSVRLGPRPPISARTVLRNRSWSRPRVSISVAIVAFDLKLQSSKAQLFPHVMSICGRLFCLRISITERALRHFNPRATAASSTASDENCQNAKRVARELDKARAAAVARASGEAVYAMQ